MAVRLRKMTNGEYQSFYQWSIADQAKDLMKAKQLSQEDAINEAAAEIRQLLPEGEKTKDHHLMVIEEIEQNEAIGLIWTMLEETEGKRQSFLCDFIIGEKWRRKGYGTEALAIMEQYAMQAGCRECVLFVAEDHKAAKALYEKCGYRFLRKMDYGSYMIKSLAANGQALYRRETDTKVV